MEELARTKAGSPLTTMLARAVVLTLSGAIAWECSCGSATAAPSLNSGQSSKIILEVVNRHFTIGRKIRSVYLRVYSDGTAVGHTEKYGNEPDIAKTKALAPKDFRKLKALLEEPELLTVQHRCGLMYKVMDSWMEWSIKIDRRGQPQRIEVAEFAPAAARRSNKPYPDVMVKLGCSIWRIRGEVYGDENAAKAGDSEDCKAVLGVD